MYSVHGRGEAGAAAIRGGVKQDGRADGRRRRRRCVRVRKERGRGVRTRRAGGGGGRGSQGSVATVVVVTARAPAGARRGKGPALTRWNTDKPYAAAPVQFHETFLFFSPCRLYTHAINT